MPAGEPGRPRLVLLVRADCHLCGQARTVLAGIAAEHGLEWAEQDVAADPALARRYAEYVPVLFLDGEVQDYWRINADRLRAALVAAPDPGRSKIARFVRRFTRT